MTKFLASVRNLEEALAAAEGGAEIIDLKAPDHGSLGALPLCEIARIVSALRAMKPTSATVGDLPMEPALVTAAVAATFDTGVDYVKVGLMPDGDGLGTVQALANFAKSGRRLVAVLFADQNPSLISPAELSAAGFAGCMLDTLDKKHGSLTQVCPYPLLQRFIREVRETGMMSGLAGSLTPGDIPALLPLEADYLGFRSALCHNHRRTGQMDESRVRRIAAIFRSDWEEDLLARAPKIRDPARAPSARDTLETT